MKVAIIGGGFSGMLAAYLLEKEGVNVTVYEKQEYIGGHCKTLISRNIYMELGTVFSFSRHIKELLIDLEIGYTERFVYRNFVDKNYQLVEHMLREDVVLLMDELQRLADILRPYTPFLAETNYGYIPEDLMLTFQHFLRKYDLKFISQVISPHLSSFGFGCIDDIQAYYVFKTFDLNTLYAFLRGEKILFINKGMSELITKLSQRISDIRYSLEVTNIEVKEDEVTVDTPYGSDCFNKVLITTKLPRGVIKEPLYNELMKKIDTNPFIVCAYEVTNNNLSTTYYKAHLGMKEKIQFFFTSKQHNRTIITAYAYGIISKEIVDGITQDIHKLGIEIKQLITVKQWYIFPHLKTHNLTPSFYKEINERQKVSNIHLIGSLVSKPSIDHLYLSIQESVNEMIRL